MFKKIIIAALLIWGLILFYQKFMAPTLDPFFEKYRGKVDFFGVSLPEDDAQAKKL
jgi:hypothetical protein